MGLQPGTRVGPHEILTLLGRGGMGEVYRARDGALERDVAIKVLPEPLAIDPDRVARLRREAQVLAGLNNPHIAHIHGLEDANGLPALVLELVEGPTLAERLAEGVLARAEVIEIADQIADGLEAAHERGVIHRDLKPANVKITPEGVVKLLDFGLAKAVAGDRPAPDLSMVTTASAEAGEILGTAAYMSPEQARGRDVDKRTDIWAFGCVLFEMLSGRRPFAGDTLSDTIAGVLTRDPDWACLPADLPAPLLDLVRRCLQKDVRLRLRDIGDARLDLQDAKTAPAGGLAPNQPAGVTRRTALVALAGAAAGAVVTGALTTGRFRNVSPRRLTRFALVMPEGERHQTSFASRLGISRNGRLLAFNTATAGPTRVYVRSLEDLDSRPLKEAAGGFAPFFSPDHRSLGFVAAAGIRRAALTGGAPQVVCTVQPGFGGATWADGDTIYLVAETPGGLLGVPAAGGRPAEIAPLDAARGDFMFKFPQALPGGRAVLLTVASATIDSFDDASIEVVTVEGGGRKVLVQGGTAARYAAGHLLYARDGALMAVRFDPDRLEVTGQPFTAMEGLLMSRNTGQANFDVADTGDLVFIPGGAEGGARTLVWVDRDGTAEDVPVPARSFLHPRLSPDGRKLAIEIEGSRHDVHVYDFASGVLSNVTTDGISHWPIWSADGRNIGYRAGPMGRFQLWQVSADGSRPPQHVPAAGGSQSAGSYAPDGRAIAYTAMTPGSPPRVSIVPLDGDRTPRPLDDGKYAQGSPKFSPDGRWLAYCSAESGKPQIYVRAMPGPGAKVQVSADGGTDPVWRRSGGELFYRNGDAMMAVPVSTGDTFTNGRPLELWKGHYSHGMSSSCGPPGPTSSNYDVTADGRRFLMIKDADQDAAVSRQIVVVLGWADELGRLSSA
jgi:serine/threonine-protein kinase